MILTIKMKCLILILAVVAAAQAQSKCSTTPPKWFGYLNEAGWEFDKANELVLRIASVSYDRDEGKMKVMDVYVGFGGEHTVEYFDYKAGTKYVVTKGKCENNTLTGNIPSDGVPSTAKYETSQFIGSSLPKLGVLVNEYNEIVRDKSIYLGTYAPVTDDTCVPIMVTSMSVAPKLSMDLLYFTNVTTTIPPGGLDKPPECH